MEHIMDFLNQLYDFYIFVCFLNVVDLFSIFKLERKTSKFSAIVWRILVQRGL